MGHGQRARARRSIPATPSWSGRATSATTRSGPDSDASVIAGLDWDRVYPLDRTDRRRRRASPATRSRSRSSTSTRRAGAGRRSCPGSGCCPTTSPTPTCGSSTSPTATSPTCARTSRSRSSRSSARWASARPARAPQPVMPPGSFGGNMDTRQLVRGATLYLPVQVERRAVLLRRRPRRQGDGEVCVTGLEAPMFASLRFTLQKGRSIPAPQYRTPGAADAGASTRRRSTARPASAATCTSPRRTPSGR